MRRIQSTFSATETDKEGHSTRGGNNTISVLSVSGEDYGVWAGEESVVGAATQ